MFGEGSSGLGHVYFHGDRIVLLFPSQRSLPLLFPVFSFLRGSGESQIFLDRVSFVFFSGRCLPLVDGFWPLRPVHTGLCQPVGQALAKEGDKSSGLVVSVSSMG